MAESQKKQVYRRFVEEVINKGNLSVIPELYHPDYLDHSAPPGAAHGGSVYEQVAAIPKMFRGAFPDVHFTIEEMIEEKPALRQMIDQSDLPWKPNEWRTQHA